MHKSDRYFRLELRFQPLLPAREIAVAWLNDCGFSMYEDFDGGVVAFALEGELDTEGMRNAIGALENLAHVEETSEWVESENWNARWESEYEPIDVEGRLCMRAPFHAPPTSGLDIIIQPEMSFGTGHHPTTWQMMRALLDMPLKDRSVLDVGCGTGVLAITAKKLGAGRVVAFDIDEWSYRNTLANLERNELTSAVEAFQGTVEVAQLDGQRFDFILANINRNILLAEMKAYAAKLNPGGSILFSGFYAADVADITAGAESVGFQKSSESFREDWACLMFVNKT